MNISVSDLAAIEASTERFKRFMPSEKIDPAREALLNNFEDMLLKKIDDFYTAPNPNESPDISITQNFKQQQSNEDKKRKIEVEDIGVELYESISKGKSHFFDSNIVQTPVVENAVFESDVIKDSRMYFNVTLTKKPHKKNRTWEEDGILIIDRDKKVYTIIVDEVKRSATGIKLPDEIVPGETVFYWNSKLVGIQDQLTGSEIQSLSACI